jgi:hypothetical protein
MRNIEIRKRRNQLRIYDFGVYENTAISWKSYKYMNAIHEEVIVGKGKYVGATKVVSCNCEVKKIKLVALNNVK